MGLFSMLRPRRVFKPATRVALMTFAWNHRHEITRWGRSLYDQFVGAREVSPTRAMRTGQLLFSIASDERLRNARELRKVTLVGDTVDLDVDERWAELPRLLERVHRVKGITDVRVNGRPDAPSRLSPMAMPA